MKEFYVLYNVGSAKYMVCHHDGQKTHPDGSRFFDIAIFHNKKKLAAFVRNLKLSGYRAT